MAAARAAPSAKGKPRQSLSVALFARFPLVQRDKLPCLEDYQFQVRQFPTLETVRGLPDALSVLEPLLHAHAEDAE